ncbi:MAG: rRNA maturation RNase YbeY [gamma proteobacterium symbiont of Bathyaustriella thionipta]|nr:rRNA maturation RNase YbeY [gamma proteobacterium symbiont of Bathyaustriella thionipta]
MQLDIQRVSNSDAPTDDDFINWTQAALLHTKGHSAVLLRLVDEAESAELNKKYRHKPGPTNVLSFPYQPSDEMDLALWGDLVICAPLVATQARQQQKTEQAHWAHLLIHGLLHLQGYDHQDKASAEEMESLEIRILSRLGFNNPYL